MLRKELGTAGPEDIAWVGCDWARFERIAAHHGIAGVLYHALHEHAAEVPEPVLQRLKLQYLANTFRAQRAATSVDAIAAALGRARVPLILLKGAALLRGLYPDAGLRPLTDIDVLIDPGDLERAGAELQRIGFLPLAGAETDGRGPLCHIHTVYQHSQPGSVPLELHWQLFEPYQPYLFDLGEVWRLALHAARMPDHVRVMTPPHELAYLCLHLERHAGMYPSLLRRSDWLDFLLIPHGAGRLVWLFDVAKLLQQRGADLDWTRFTGTAERWAIAGRLHAVFELCRRGLGVAPPPEVLRSLDPGGARLADRIAHRAVLESVRAGEVGARSSGTSRARWVAMLSGHVLRACHSWTSLFPGAAYLRAKYAGRSSALRRWVRHAREILPQLWAELRQRAG